MKHLGGTNDRSAFHSTVVLEDESVILPDSLSLNSLNFQRVEATAWIYGTFNRMPSLSVKVY